MGSVNDLQSGHAKSHPKMCWAGVYGRFVAAPNRLGANPADQQIAGGVLITNELDDIDGVPGAPKSLASKCVSGQVKKSLIHDSISSEE